MSTNDETRGAQVIWFYGWSSAELAELLTPAVAECHIHKGAVVQANMAPKHYFSGTVHEIRMIRGHLLIEGIAIEEVTPDLWACNKSNWDRRRRPHIMMGKAKVMNIQGTVTGRMSYGKPNIQVKRDPK